MNKSKFLAFFKCKVTKGFKNYKKFWEFYKSSVKIRSDKSQSDFPTLIIDNDIAVTDPEELSTLFNNVFTSIGSVSICKNDECVNFTDIFTKFEDEKKFNTSMVGFALKHASIESVKNFIKEMPPSSPGSSGISSKILKLIPDTLAPIFTKIINFSITTSSIPEDWKSALITPLFKNKEKTIELLTNSIPRIIYGSMKGHSCEIAHHELISDIKKTREKKLTRLKLFIDFEKAFDTVDSKLFLTKLFNYSFDTASMLLVADYFNNRHQKTKIDNISSKSPLFF